MADRYKLQVAKQTGRVLSLVFYSENRCNIFQVHSVLGIALIHKCLQRLTYMLRLQNDFVSAIFVWLKHVSVSIIIVYDCHIAKSFCS